MLAEPKDEPFWSTTSWLQLGFGICANLTGVMVGLCYGYSAVAMPSIKSDPHLNSTLSDQSWIASVLSLSAPFGCFLSGYCMEKCGRRLTIIFCELPMAAGFLYIALAQSTQGIIIGRVIKGFGMGMAMPAPRVYCSEICLPRLRAVVSGAIPNLAMGMGLVLSATLGTFVPWRNLCYISIVCSVVIMCFGLLLPESPYFLLMKGDIASAKANLARVRSKKFDLNAEIRYMVKFKELNEINRLHGMELFRSLFKRSSCRPFCIIAVYVTFTQFSGVTVATFWTVEILKDSKSTFDPHIGNIINSVSRCLSGLLLFVLLYHTGRRVLGITSAVGTGLCRIALSLHVEFAKTPEFWPQVYATLYTIFTAIGYNTLPLLLMSEMYPLQVRGMLGGITVAIINFLMFVANKSYPYMKENMGFSKTFLFYGCCSLACAIYLFFFLPETKGLSLQQIEDFFHTRLVSNLSRIQMSIPEFQRKQLKKSVSIILPEDRQAEAGTRKYKDKSNDDDNDGANSSDKATKPQKKDESTTKKHTNKQKKKTNDQDLKIDD